MTFVQELRADNDSSPGLPATDKRGARIGYICAATSKEAAERLRSSGCKRLFTDAESSAIRSRPGYRLCRSHLQAGDTLVVPSWANLTGSMTELVTVVAELAQDGVGVRSLEEDLDSSLASEQRVAEVFLALSEFARKDKAPRKKLGRPRAMNDEQVVRARELLAKPGISVSAVATELGVSRPTLYKYVGDAVKERKSLSAPTLIPEPELRQPAVTPPPVSDPEVPASSKVAGCPCCGYRASNRFERAILNQDLKHTWLYAAADGPGVVERQHCGRCQPHVGIGMVSCAVCEDGPMLAGGLTKDRVIDWLTAQGWIQLPGDGVEKLLCPRDVARARRPSVANVSLTS